MTEKKASLSSQAFSLYRHQAKKVFPTAFNFTMILIAVLALGIWINESVYLTVPLIVLPFFFAYQMATDYLQKGSAITNRQFFAYYGGYFSMPFVGCYRVIRNFFFALLYSMGGAFLIGIGYYAIASALSPTFQSAVQALSDLLQNSNVNDINAYLASTPDLVYFYTTIALSENAIFFYVFFHFIASYGLNPYLRFVISGASPRVCNAIYVGGIRLVRRSFWKDYYGALWHGTLLLLVGYGSGVGIGFVFSGSASLLGICGFAGASLLLSFYLPYYFDVVSLLADKYHASFADYSIQMAEMTLKELEKSRKLTDEEAAGLQRSIASAKRVRDRKPGDPEDKDDEDQGEDGGDDSSDDER